MRNLIALSALVTAAVALGGCNYSNEDLIFLAALPSRDTLEAKVPEDATAQQGLGQRRDGLSENGPSNTYQRTRDGAKEFNGGLLRILDIIEHVRKLRPSARTEDSRTWGPFTDEKAPDRQTRLVITRVEPEGGMRAYVWSIDLKKKAETEWLSVITGSYSPRVGDDVTRGAGTMQLNLAEARAKGFLGADDDRTLQSMEVRYITDEDPVHVEMVLQFRREGFFETEEWTLNYESKEFADQSGSLKFEIIGDFFKNLGNQKETLTILGRWTATGAGRADLTVSGGDVGDSIEAGAECWDENFLTVYGFEEVDVDIDGNGITNEPGGTGVVGNAAACAIQ